LRTATLDQEENGLPAALLDATDVLLWWGHMAHERLSEEVAAGVQRRVLEGMGFIALHSAHFCKPFKRLMGTNCSLKWREADERERLWVVEPGHPIAAGLGEQFVLPMEETYGERFDIPRPDATILISWFEGGNVFRSGCAWERGNGRVFYFRPGHETYPTYYDPNVQRVISNAVGWAAPRVNIVDDCPNEVLPHEKVAPKGSAGK
jgi:trehalose utilization protein